MVVSVLPVQSGRDLADVRALFREYATSLGIDLAFQGFEAELAGLPGSYAPPGGALFLAQAGGPQPLGCVGLRALQRTGACEIKRLYVRPESRGTGAGRMLATHAIEWAEARGYTEALLDTLPEMSAAIALYRSLGFADVAPYGNSMVPGMICLGKSLRPH